ncbi:Ribosomal RNA small subunit methyltransferase NEP1 [Dictyocoela muelleri]|nr:Ribosomal RNA small subunit methyltransferase NEP1 [Dictyocoela muelleri]
MKIKFILTQADLETKKQSTRIDILHQSLLSILDSPLCKKGFIEIYVISRKNIIIEVSKKIRLPRTCERFKKIINDLLLNKKLKNKNEVLMRIIEKIDFNGYKKICCSVKGDPVEINDGNYAIHVNMIQRGDDYVGNVDLMWRVGNIELTAHVVCSRICAKFEDFLGLI